MTRRLPLGECRDCGNPIRFVQLDTGTALPVDPQPNPRGNVCAQRIGGQLHGHVISHHHPAIPGAERWMPHHATCPERPPRIARPKREPEPTLFD